MTTELETIQTPAPKPWDHSRHYNHIKQETELSEPYGWIQWKGTDVCIDLHCKCGAHWHLDADFAYTTICPRCQTLFSLGAFIKLVPITDPGEIDYVLNKTCAPRVAEDYSIYNEEVQ